MNRLTNESVDAEISSGDDFVEIIANADRKVRSWRKKIGWIHDLLFDRTFEVDNEKLVYLAIYLKFIGNGDVPVGEDGGHYRPSHHAMMSSRIHGQLSKISSPENALILRKIYPWLPSFNSPFMRAEPLTLIRDIAHRNDIPKELKEEIKNTLQNKLHRSAAPEDLLTSAKLLEKITAPDAGYPPPFIKEFKKFHEELTEFFNARSLDQQLSAICQKTDGNEKSLISLFLEQKEKADTPEKLLSVLGLLTELRTLFSARISGKKTGSETQELQIADIRLEDFSFVLLSRFINYITDMTDEMSWSSVLHCFRLAIVNLRLGGFDAEECLAVESEVNTWSKGFNAGNREHLLHLKSTVDRAQRLVEDYCHRIIDLFPGKTERLGKALGVDQHAIKLFSESEIRSHPVFQVSKLVDFLLKNIRFLALLPPWKAIVTGKVSGELVTVAGFTELSGSFDRSVIALMDNAEGNEEPPDGVVGIIVGHDIPLLSHLAVRARQREIAFAVCEDTSLLFKLKDLAETLIVFDVSPDRVGIETAMRTEGAHRQRLSKESRNLPVADLNCPQRVLFVNRVVASTGGQKAYAARRLEEFSKDEGAGFVTPRSCVIPFGVMEESLRDVPELEKKYRSLAGMLNNSLPEKDLNNVLHDMRNIIFQLHVPEEVLLFIGDTFKGHAHFMVRSSSNCEDLEDYAGAGIYDSVTNVDSIHVVEAIHTVWASLWTVRAAVSRRSAGIPHDTAHMAVLVQEMIIPDYSFIMHTVNPITWNHQEIYTELAVGMGETLASGREPGTPFRMIVNKGTGSIQVVAFASFSSALVANSNGVLIQKKVDYSTIELSVNKSFRTEVGSRLAEIGRFVEDSFGSPQDIEGLILDKAFYLVQSRPQIGVIKNEW